MTVHSPPSDVSVPTTSVRSPFPDIPVPDADIATFFFGHAQRIRDQRVADGQADEPPLLVDGETGEPMTFSELKRESEAIAAALAARGFSWDIDTTGNELAHVAVVYAPATIHACSVHYGTLIAGGVYTAIAPVISGPDLAQRLEDVRAAVVFVAPSLLPQLQEAIALLPAEAPAVDIILTRAGDAPYPSLDALPRVPDREMLQKLADTRTDVAERVAVVMYTSGSTGRPKGVVYTHRNVVAMFTAVHEFGSGGWGFDPRAHLPSSSEQPRVLSMREPWHVFGYMALCCRSLVSGAMYVQLPRCPLGQYLAAIERHRINYLYGCPALLHRICVETTRIGHRLLALKADPEQTIDISTLQVILVGTTALLPQRQRQYADHLDGVLIFDGYGQTEAGMIAGSGSRVKAAPGYLVLSPNVVAKVIDADGSQADSYGELCLLSPQRLRRYADGGLPPTDSEGYLRTGDYVHLTQDGHISIKGRMQELIHTAEGIVYPVDIDNELARLPAVRDSLVVARGDACPVALVVLQPSPDAPVSLEDIEELIKQKTGAVIKCCEVAEVPRVECGKVSLPALRAMVDSW
ncbi:4-coumarate--CoA ligase [Coemansia helicoidea]|uniref:4-coumarate--CoA ligase n=1 Tax=Coemansia helicoidea TaxID=1286919 RepID=A0ACC1L8S8_9FUNG|nr:4-coumarate--CoA ligase [Coemansia helicoidea]